MRICLAIVACCVLSTAILGCSKGRAKASVFEEMEFTDAAFQGDIAKVRELLGTRNVDSLLTAKGNNGNLPLHLAAGGGHVKIIQLLLAQGADIKAGNDVAATALHVAAASGQKTAAALLILHGADVNATDKAGYTPLHYAARFGKDDVIELLLKKGANPNAVSHDDVKPLHAAEREGNTAAAAIIRRYGGTA